MKQLEAQIRAAELALAAEHTAAEIDFRNAKQRLMTTLTRPKSLGIEFLVGAALGYLATPQPASPGTASVGGDHKQGRLQRINEIVQTVGRYLVLLAPFAKWLQKNPMEQPPETHVHVEPGASPDAAAAAGQAATHAAAQVQASRAEAA